VALWQGIFLLDQYAIAKSAKIRRY